MIVISGFDLHVITVCLRNLWNLLIWSVFFLIFSLFTCLSKVSDSLNYHASAHSSSELSQNHFHSSVSLCGLQACCICERIYQWQKRLAWASVTTLKTSDKELVIRIEVKLIEGQINLLQFGLIFHICGYQLVVIL